MQDLERNDQRDARDFWGCVVQDRFLHGEFVVVCRGMFERNIKVQDLERNDQRGARDFWGCVVQDWACTVNSLKFSGEIMPKVKLFWG